jgi:hypothetical protein
VAWYVNQRAGKDGDVTIRSCSAICDEDNDVTNVGQPAVRDSASGVTIRAAGGKCDAKEAIHSVARRMNVTDDLLLHIRPWAQGGWVRLRHTPVLLRKTGGASQE